MRLKTVITFILLLAFAALLPAQSPTIYSAAPGMLLTPQTTDVIAVPTSTTAVTASNAWISNITLVGPTTGSSTIHVTLTCNATGNPVLNGTGVTATTTYSMPLSVWCRSGFSISADGAGAFYQIVWRQ